MLGNRMCFAAVSRASHRFEGHASGFPAEGMREYSGRRRESRGVFRNIKRLNYILRILAGWITPAGDLNVHFAVVPICSRVIPSKHAKNDHWLKMRGIPHDEGIRAIAKAAREGHFGACPLARHFRDAQVQRSTRIYPCVARIVAILATAVTGSIADSPLLPAEEECLGDRGPQAPAFRNRHREHAASQRWRLAHHLQRPISGSDKEGGILRSDMG